MYHYYSNVWKSFSREMTVTRSRQHAPRGATLIGRMADERPEEDNFEYLSYI